MALTARQITARIPLQSPKWVPKCPFWRQLPLGGSVGRSAPQQPPNRTINSNLSLCFSCDGSKQHRQFLLAEATGASGSNLCSLGK